MAKFGTAWIEFKGDVSALGPSMRRAQGIVGKGAAGMESRTRRAFAGMSQAASVAGVGIGAGIAGGVVLGTKKSVDAAVDLNEQMNKVAVVFRGSEKDILRWSDNTAKSLGISQRAALESAGVFGNMLVPMGFAREEAGRMSTRMVDLAADMASFNNADPSEVLDSIRAGLAGETEPLRRLGVFLNDARLKQEALNLGLKDAVGPNGALTANARTQAAYSLILKDTADAQGDFARTSDSLANKQRILKAQMENIGASLGTALIPPLQVAADHVSDFADRITQIIERDDLSADQKFKRVGDEISNELAAAVPKIADTAGRLAPKVAEGFVRGFANAGIWGQIAIGAFLVSKLVGWKAILGKAARAGAGVFGKTFGGTATAGAAAGTRTAAAASLAQAPAFEPAGAAAGAAWSAGYRAATVAAPPVPAPVPGRGPTTTTTPVPGRKVPPKTKTPPVVVPPVVVPDAGGKGKLGKLGGKLGTAGKVAGRVAGVGFVAGMVYEIGRGLESFTPEINVDKRGDFASKFGASLKQAFKNPFDLSFDPYPGDQKSPLQKLFGGGGDKEPDKAAEAFKRQAAAITQTRASITELGRANDRERATASAFSAAQRRVTDLRRAGKAGTHEYAVALRALNAAETEHLQATARVNTARSKARDGAKADVAAAREALRAARAEGAGKDRLAELSHRVAQARSRETAAILNVNRASRGLNAITGPAANQMGALLKQLRGVAGVGQLRNFISTASVSDAKALVRTVGELHELGRQRTALKIIAESKNPEDALRRLRGLIGDLADRRHRIKVEAQDDATRRLEALKRRIDRMPTKKRLTFEAHVQLSRDTANAFQRAGQGSAAKAIMRGIYAPQRGMVVPGTGDGDKVPALLEPGEGVVNKRAVKQMGGPAAIHQINRDTPRFQRGGVVGGDSDDPGRRVTLARTSRDSGVSPADVTKVAREADSNRAVASIAAAAFKQFASIGLGVLSGFRGGDITSSGNPSNHGKHAAIDIAKRGKQNLTGAANTRVGKWIASTFPESVRGTSEDVLYVGNDLPTGEHWNHVHVAAFGAQAIGKAMGGAVGGDGTGERPKGPPRYKRLTLGQYVTAAKQAGFPDPALAAAVFYAESRGNVRAENKRLNASPPEWSLGAAQINVLAHKRFNNPRDRKRLQEDVFFNMRAAKQISGGGRNWKPWTMFTNGEYKKYLGGKATPLPGGGTGAGATGQGSGYADFLALKLLEAEATDGTRDDRRWINKALRYWRGVYKRNRSAGNWQRAGDAFSQMTTLRERKAELLAPPEDSLFELGELAYIGKDEFLPMGKATADSGPPPTKQHTWTGSRWVRGPVKKSQRVSIGGIQRTLDQIELESAEARLASPPWDDDIRAAQRLVDIWTGLRTLTVGGKIPGFSIGDYPFPGGTIKQRTIAATELGSAQDALKSIKDEAKADGETATDSRRADILEQLLEQERRAGAILRAVQPVTQRFAELPRFHEGGVVPGQPYQEVPIMAKGGEAIGYAGKPQPSEVFVAVVVEDGAVNEGKIRAVALDAADDRDRELIRRARARGATVGQKMRMG